MKKTTYCALFIVSFFNGLHTEDVDKISQLRLDVNQLGDEIAQISKLKPDFEKRINEIERKKQELNNKMHNLNTIISRFQNEQRGIYTAIKEYKDFERELHDTAKATRQQKIEKNINDIRKSIAKEIAQANEALKQTV